MKKYGMVLCCALFFLPVISMHIVPKYTSKTMLQAIEEGNFQLVRLHKQKNTLITKEILWAIYTTKNASLYALFFKGFLNLNANAFEHFIQEYIQKYGVIYNHYFFDFVHRIIGLTGIVPTFTLFNTITLYSSPFMQWYFDEIKTGMITPQSLQILHNNVKRQRDQRKDLTLSAFFRIGNELFTGIFFDDGELKDYYLKKTGNQLTYEIIKKDHAVTPLIISTIGAVVTGNIDIIEYMLHKKLLPLDEELILHAGHYAFLCNGFLLGYGNFLDNTSQEKLFYTISDYWKFNEQGSHEIVFYTFESLIQYLRHYIPTYKPHEIKSTFFSILLKIACIYGQLDMAKLLICLKNISNETTFIQVKEVMESFLIMIKQLKKQLKKKSDEYYIRTFEILYKEIKEYVVAERLYAKIMKNKHTFKFCKLPLLSESEKNIIVPAEIGLKILEYCPVVYEKIKLNKKVL